MNNFSLDVNSLPSNDLRVIMKYNKNDVHSDSDISTSGISEPINSDSDARSNDSKSAIRNTQDFNVSVIECLESLETLRGRILSINPISCDDNRPAYSSSKKKKKTTIEKIMNEDVTKNVMNESTEMNEFAGGATFIILSQYL